MLNLQQIYKPGTLEDALRLLQQPGTVVLAGGTDLIAARRKDIQAVVDLSELGLAYITQKGDAVVIGAMTRLADLAASALPGGANGIVRTAIARSKTSVLRNQATVAGTIIAEPAGILATALAALEARVVVLPQPAQDADGAGIVLDEFLAKRTALFSRAIVTEIRIPQAALARHSAIETVARTPLDTPIVTVAVSLEVQGDLVKTAAIALGGVAETVLRADGAERGLAGQELTGSVIAQISDAAGAGVVPLADFRGSSEYRREMIRVLTARALAGISQDVAHLRAV